MATRDELMTALRNADAAGASEDAQRLATMLKAMPVDAPAVAPAPVAPAPQPSTLDKINSKVGSIAKTYVTDPLIGMAKGARDTIEGLDKELITGPAGAPTGSDVETAAKNYKSDESKTLDEMYKKAGPTAGVGKFVQEASMVPIAGPERAASGVVGKVLSRALAGSTGGAAGGAVLAPGAGETPLQGAVKGAIGGAVAGPVLGAGADGVLAAKKALQGPLTRAAEMFKKGGVDIPQVSANLDVPVTLPMSTAAHAGSPELAAFEKTARGSDQGSRAGRWEKLDDQTNAAAWDQTGDALGNSIADLQPRKDAVTLAMKPAQDKLNGIKFKNDDKDSLILQLEQLKRSPNFASDSGGQRELNRVLTDATGPDVTLGSLANLDTELAAGGTKYRLNDRQAKEVRDRVRAMIDSRSDGAWSQAHADLAAARTPLEQSESANAIYNDFSDPFGGAKGKTMTGLPTVNSTKLQGSVNRRGTDASDPTAPRDVMDPNDRQSLESVIDSLRRAEYPRTSSVPAAQMPGLRDPGVPFLSMKGVGQFVSNKLLGSRSRATRDAASDALSGAEGWNKMLEAAKRSNDISASDAAMLADILRGVGPASGAAAVQSGEKHAP